MTSVTETAASRPAQTQQPRIERDLPSEVQRFRNDETDQLLHDLAERARNLRALTGHILDHNELFAGLEDLAPRVSLQEDPIFNNKPHPFVEGSEWNLGAAIEIRGFTLPLAPKMRVVILTPHATEDIDPRVYATGNVKGKIIKEIVAKFSRGLNDRIDQIMSQHSATKALPAGVPAQSVSPEQEFDDMIS